MSGKRSRSSLKGLDTPTYKLKRHLTNPERLIRNPKSWARMALGLSLVLAFTVPIFRSGLRDRLTLWEWLINHTIWGPPVEYIPEEDYAAIFEKEKQSNSSIAQNNPSSTTETDGIIVTSKGGRGYNE